MDDCAICGGALGAGVRAFQADVPEGDSGGQTYRLTCGHAFHTPCLVPCLRAAGPACPVCRDRAGAPAAEPQQLRARGQRLLIFTSADDDEDEDEDEEDSDVDAEAAFRGDPEMHAIRSNNVVVRGARQSLASALRGYSLLRDRLRQERRASLRDALLALRRRRFRDFNSARERVRQALDAARRAEEQAFISAHGLAAFEARPWARQHRQQRVHHLLLQRPLPFHSTRHQDPMRRSFWHA